MYVYVYGTQPLYMYYKVKMVCVLLRPETGEQYSKIVFFEQK